ncbi:hypothetical protein C1I98_06210 [Spongiactinospora gelatinilytica]|uniref:HNH nuclease domain-containing protein n=1 Tax=Spongiactinospora gelatinilytica TaxID=2666298 RepID=A0A2W2HTC9_9ACTN|nr:hypothetical protein C1I98_06210 [Spongiactinospora gelatinilytica]
MPRRPDTPCSSCGKLLWSGTTSLPAGSLKCRPCRRAASKAPCTTCGLEFDAWTGGHRRRTCSSACEREARLRAITEARQAPRPLRACEDCLVAVATCGVVALCDRCRVVRKALRDLEHWRRKNRRRRLDLARVASEPYTLVEIAERDGFCCQICRDPVDMKLVWPKLWAPTIDHVVPVVAGGDDTPANVQLAHFVCNSRKGGRLELAS